MKIKIKIIAFALSVFLLACSKDDNEGSGSGSVAAASLVSPENNTECNTGSPISATETSVTFQWNAVEGATGYFVYLKNLNTPNAIQYNAGTNNSLAITLLKGTLYSWYVVANANGSTAQSETWKFYNAGEGVSNYAPFPADVVTPVMSSSITGSLVTLEWTASDLDNDIVEYKVYMDSNSNPSTLKATVATKKVENVAVTANTTYYWKVDTKDSAGNISHSQVFQFKVL